MLLCRCEVALIQNEITNIFADDFAVLSDEEGMSGSRKESSISETQSFTHLTYSKNKVRALWARVRVGLRRAPGAGCLASAAFALATWQALPCADVAWYVVQVVSAIQWLPHRRGVVAVACTEALSHGERVQRAGRPSNAYILVWNFKVGGSISLIRIV